MLVLSRKVDCGVVITVPPSSKPQQIRLKIIKTHCQTAWLGFDAGRDVVIDRAEIDSRKKLLQPAGGAS